MIDAATRANLELMRTLSGERGGALIAAIDRTVTVAGARLLGQRLAAPLTDPAAINARLDAVALFAADGAARSDARTQLSAAPDLARSLSRLVLARGGPRDLAAVRDGLVAAAALSRRLARIAGLRPKWTPPRRRWSRRPPRSRWCSPRALGDACPI